MHYNIYWVDAGYYNYVVEMIDIWSRYEESRSCGFVIAMSRGQAKSKHIQNERKDPYGNHHLEYTDKMLIKLIKKGFASEEEAGAWLDAQYGEAVAIAEMNVSKEEQFQLLKEAVERGNPVINLSSFEENDVD